MRSGAARGMIHMAGWLWIASAVAFLPAGRAPAQNGRHDDQQITRLVESGELDQAEQTAEQLADERLRQKWLYELARRRSEGGDYNRAVRLVGQMGNDRLRTAALDQIVQARGGATMADFDPLIELMQNTVVPDAWLANGGTADIQPFAAGVLVDVRTIDPVGGGDPAIGQLATRASRHRPSGAAGQPEPRGPSARRYVSLVELERQIQLRGAMGLPPTPGMYALAGLWRIDAVYVDEDHRDIVLVGPADDWTWNPQTQTCETPSGSPVLRLDDLVAVLRTVLLGPGHFSCSINPLPENLQRTAEFVQQQGNKTLRPGERSRWLGGLREALGQQQVELKGVDRKWHVSKVLFIADHHMKQIGMGLADGVEGVPSYLDLIQVPPGEGPPPMDVLRWWFTLADQPIHSDPQHRIFHLPDHRVRVLSENELLTLQGQRVHTGQADKWNREFAENFTRHFPQLAQRYPLYAELDQVFQLALVAGILRHQHWPDRIGWHVMHWRDDRRFPLPADGPPQRTDSIVHHRKVGGFVFAGASGGVVVQPVQWLQEGRLRTDYQLAAPGDARTAGSSWWWE